MAPDRQAPDKPPTPQIATNDLDIKGVGKLNEWDDIAKAVDNIRKYFALSDNKRHRKRRAEGGIDASILQPLIGDTILDTRKAQDASGIIDWDKVEVQDWTRATPNSLNHPRMLEISHNFNDKEILYEAEHGVKDTSTCINSVRISSHHSGATELHEKARATQKAKTRATKHKNTQQEHTLTNPHRTAHLYTGHRNATRREKEGMLRRTLHGHAVRRRPGTTSTSSTATTPGRHMEIPHMPRRRMAQGR